jgi:hypothetical protein
MLTNTFGNFGLSKKQHRRTKLVKRRGDPVDLGVDFSSSGDFSFGFKSMPGCFDFLLDNDGPPALLLSPFELYSSTRRQILPPPFRCSKPQVPLMASGRELVMPCLCQALMGRQAVRRQELGGGELGKGDEMRSPAASQFGRPAAFLGLGQWLCS